MPDILLQRSPAILGLVETVITLGRRGAGEVLTTPAGEQRGTDRAQRRA